MPQDHLGPQAYISRIERGMDVSLSSIEKLAKAMGMHPIELFARAVSWQTGTDPVELLRSIASDMELRHGEPPSPPSPLTSPPL